jgi:hypothetical protein
MLWQPKGALGFGFEYLQLSGVRPDTNETSAPLDRLIKLVGHCEVSSLTPAGNWVELRI